MRANRWNDYDGFEYCAAKILGRIMTFGYRLQSGYQDQFVCSATEDGARALQRFFLADAKNPNCPITYLHVLVLKACVDEALMKASNKCK